MMFLKKTATTCKLNFPKISRSVHSPEVPLGTKILDPYPHGYGGSRCAWTHSLLFILCVWYSAKLSLEQNFELCMPINNDFTDLNHMYKAVCSGRVADFVLLKLSSLKAKDPNSMLEDFVSKSKLG